MRALIPHLLAILLTATSAQAHTCRCFWYGQGRRTANGERFRPDGFTAAHRSLPFGTVLRVVYRARSVVVRINDRGPFVRGRCLDLSDGARRALNMPGVAMIDWMVR